MKRKTIDTSREIRLWITTVLPILSVTVSNLYSDEIKNGINNVVEKMKRRTGKTIIINKEEK